ncbi:MULTISPECIES: VOC family protein [unclassified Mesorhizobium]|uniref:VOC family protein n=1 Tax=unclassified Mesorhizobium TaxID=325217 RepID=UPI00112B0AB8|nr:MULTISPECIES: VOC family protein [unclassified Mesorhizobium]MBZ9808596.1 VOC family protein [Mesorhizobium sp. ESP-6-2]TPM33288.1 VOC family protein [Mesorhizobium sp. B2-2-2]
MKARISVITLGVDNLEASLEFYRTGLGLPSEGIIGREFEHGAVAFFTLHGGLKFAIFERSSIAHDAGIAHDADIGQSGRSPTELTLGHNVASEAEVDAVMAEAVKAGAHLVKPAQKTFWGGYAGYFQDPDDHLWEVVYNPAFVPED